MTIWKYALEIKDTQTIPMPAGSRILSIQEQNRVVCLWALVDPDVARVKRIVHVRGTGHSCDCVNAEDFVGTVQILGGQLVFHVFVEPERTAHPARVGSGHPVVELES